MELQPPFRALSSTGSIAAGSNELTLAAGAGFEPGDTVIVEIGGEAGGGWRGSDGVGGTWPRLSFPDAASREAASPPAEGTYAWDRDTGNVYRYIAGSWTRNNGYYIEKAIPKALVARIVGIEGVTATLDASAAVTAIGASVHFDNRPVFDQAVATAPLAGVVLRLPAGHFAVSDELSIEGRDDWRIVGQGKAHTTLFSPHGTPSASIVVRQSARVAIADLHVLGNARQTGFGLHVTETAVPQGSAWPRAIYYERSDYGTVSDVTVTDAFQLAAGCDGAVEFWAHRVEAIATEPLRQYIQWLFLWANSKGGGAVDCCVDSPVLTAGFEGFAADGVSFVRPVGRNATMSLNGSGGWLIDAAELTVEAGSQFIDEIGQAPVSKYVPIINVNTNTGGGLAELGGTIRNPRIVQKGPINADNDVLRAIVINAQNPMVSIVGGYPGAPWQGGYIAAPDWQAPSTLDGPRAIVSDNAAITVRGIRAVGTTKGPAQGNIHAASGTVSDCVADRITGNATTAGNITNAEYEAMPMLSVYLGGYGHTRDMSDADAGRFVAALKAFYGSKADGTEMTDTEALDRWCAGIAQSATDITRKVESAAARKAADATVSDIVIA